MIMVGTCSWAEKTLVESGEFYPREARSAEARLRYYASCFDTVEVDATYYAIPDQRTVWLWGARTPERLHLPRESVRRAYRPRDRSEDPACRLKGSRGQPVR